MDQKPKRGRPRQFDEQETLTRIMKLFWDQGYSATSLDQICEATGLNRPSLYRAFGDKKQIYFKALRHYSEDAYRRVKARVSDMPPGRERVLAVLDIMIDIYTQPGTNLIGRGCFNLNTLPAEAGNDPEFREEMQKQLDWMARGFANSAGVGDQKVEELGKLLAMTQLGLSTLARAGMPPDELRSIAKANVERLLPPEAEQE